MRWARPLGPRRARGTNPRARGTDLRSRLVAPRHLPYPTNPRFERAAYELSRAPLRPVEAPRPPIPHRASRQLAGMPTGAVGDSGWRRRAVLVSGPCARCGDNGWLEVQVQGAGVVSVVVCAERISPAVAGELEPDGEPP